MSMIFSEKESYSQFREQQKNSNCTHHCLVLPTPLWLFPQHLEFLTHILDEPGLSHWPFKETKQIIFVLQITCCGQVANLFLNRYLKTMYFCIVILLQCRSKSVNFEKECIYLKLGIQLKVLMIQYLYAKAENNKQHFCFILSSPS